MVVYRGSDARRKQMTRMKLLKSVILLLSILAFLPACTAASQEHHVGEDAIISGKLRKRKRAFLDMVDGLETRGENYTQASVDKAYRDFLMMFVLTENDTQKWAARHGYKEGEYDLLPLWSLLTQLMEKPRVRAHAVKYFSQIRHSEFKLLSASLLLFKYDQHTIAIAWYLEKALEAPDQRKLLKDWMGPDWPRFKRNVAIASAYYKSI